MSNIANSGIYFLLNKARKYVFIHYSKKDVDSQYETIRKKLNKNKFKADRLQEYWNQDLEQSFVFVRQYLKDEDKLRPRVEKWVDYLRKNNFEVEHFINKAVLKKEWEIDQASQRKDADLWEVNVDLKARLNEMRKYIDYNLKYASTRTSLVKQLIKDNDKWLSDYLSSIGFINKQVKTKSNVLSEKDMFCAFLTKAIGDYMVFPKYKTFKQEQKKLYLLNKYKNKRNRRRESLVDDFTTVNENTIVRNPYKMRKKEDNYKLVPKQEITEKDRKDFKELDMYQSLLDFLTETLGKSKNTSKEDRMKARELIKQKYGKEYLGMLDRIYQELQLDIPKIKDSICRTIYFKKLGGDSTVYNFDNDTGYFNESGDYVLVSENKIKLNNPDHVFAILDNYSSLRESCFETPDSDLWAILHDFDDLVEKSNFDEYVKDILIMKIDGIGGKEICEEIFYKHKIELTDDKLSYIYKTTIPKTIVSTYDHLYEEWLYTYRVKGKYKTCSKCGEVKLANEKYFSPDKRMSDGLRGICNKCR